MRERERDKVRESDGNNEIRIVSKLYITKELRKFERIFRFIDFENFWNLVHSANFA